MAKKTPTWLLGCGIGCGVLLVGAAALIGLGAWWTRGTLKGFENSVASRAEIESRFGQPEEYAPAPDGAIPAGRMEAFLAVREATQPSRARIAEAFDRMPLDEKQARELDEKPFMEKLSQVFGIMGGAFSMVGGLGGFFEERNQALLASEMGMGEYTYIYVLAYYDLLGHAPGDGPGDAHGSRGPGTNHGDVRVMGASTRNDSRDHMEAIIRNQLATLPEEAPADWRALLEAELQAMAEDPHRLPWRDGLPDAIRASLEPYGDRLEATYSPATNGLELARTRKRDSMSFTMD